jgi:hypothetical protein
VTAVLGGHADMLITSVSTSVPYITSGQMRGLAVSSMRRMGGVLAAVPTWQELGFQSSGSWKGVMGPKASRPRKLHFGKTSCAAYRRAMNCVSTPTRTSGYLNLKNASETKKWLDEEFAALKNGHDRTGAGQAIITGVFYDFKTTQAVLRVGAQKFAISMFGADERSAFGEIYKAFLDHGILLFRNQDITREHISISAAVSATRQARCAAQRPPSAVPGTAAGHQRTQCRRHTVEFTLYRTPMAFGHVVYASDPRWVLC